MPVIKRPYNDDMAYKNIGGESLGDTLGDDCNIYDTDDKHHLAHVRAHNEQLSETSYSEQKHTSVSKCDKQGNRKCCQGVTMFVAVVCVLFFAESMCSNGLIGATMSTVEKRYGIRSAHSGWIPSSYELTGIPVMLLVGIVGSRIHRPRCMALAGLVSAAGALVYTLPHFIDEPRLQTTRHDSQYCTRDAITNGTSCFDTDISSTSSQFYLTIFILAAIFMSFGAGPMYVMGSAYIDDSTSPGQSAFYIGQFSAILCLIVFSISQKT